VYSETAQDFKTDNLAFACIVENGGFGRSAAAPVCREMIRKAL
jgi:cell division protein FtsI/penicillin-binding protein 2